MYFLRIRFRPTGYAVLLILLSIPLMGLSRPSEPWIAFQYYDDHPAGVAPTAELRLIDPNGRRERTIFKGQTVAIIADWSRNGDIVFSSGDHLLVVDWNGDNRRPLDPRPKKNGSYQYPRWSPNGRQIVFQDFESQIAQISIFDMGTTTTYRITSDNWNHESPDWSSDGKRILFTAWGEGGGPQPSDIFIMQLQSNENAQNITRTPVYELYPSWSPDGNTLVFVRAEGIGNRRIAVMDIDNGQVREITNDKLYVLYSSWAPNGNQIVFSASRNHPEGISRDANLYVVNKDGSALRQITYYKSGVATYPTWYDPAMRTVLSSNNKVTAWGTLKSKFIAP